MSRLLHAFGAGARPAVRGIDWRMTRFSKAFSRKLEAEAAAEELAKEAETELGGCDRVIGGVLFATAAAGHEAHHIARRLGERWPRACLLGSSFEGVVVDGRTIRDEPAFVLLAWQDGPCEPIPLVFDRDESGSVQIADAVLEAADGRPLSARDLVLLFPDALGSNQLERVLKELGPLLGQAWVAGAASTGLDGHPALAYCDAESHPGGTVGLYVPGAMESDSAPQVRGAGGSRAASPWLEITACRSRWVDLLEGEPPADWVRRQLGLGEDTPIEAQLDRLLVRIRPRPAPGASEPDGDFDERYVIGVDEKRGALSLPRPVSCGDQLAFALPDPEMARESLRVAIGELAMTPFLMQFACRARDADFHGDPDLESAWVAHHAADRQTLGVVAPFQLAKEENGRCRVRVHSTVLAALGRS
jgi:small ligand-binding sensory domain FIST